MPTPSPGSTYWSATAQPTEFPRLAGKLHVDVAIIGGGIVGITTARLLKDSGLKVAVLEARRVFVERRGKLEATDVTFQDDAHLMKIIDKIVSRVGRRGQEGAG